MMIGIFYATTSGNTEFVVERFYKKIVEKGFKAKVVMAEFFKPEDFEDCSLFVFATSTWDHDDINPLFYPVFNVLEKYDFSGKLGIFIGLGDKRYTQHYFCRGVDKVAEAFQKQGGKVIGEVLKVNGEPYHQLDSVIDPWIDSFFSLLKEIKYEQN